MIPRKLLRSVAALVGWLMVAAALSNLSPVLAAPAPAPAMADHTMHGAMADGGCIESGQADHQGSPGCQEHGHDGGCCSQVHPFVATPLPLATLQLHREPIVSDYPMNQARHRPTVPERPPKSPIA